GVEGGGGAGVLLIGPVEANRVAKLANGLCDNCLTCVWRAWEPGRPVVLAPAMNTLMWEHPLTGRHLRQLAEDAGAGPAPAGLDLLALVSWVNAACPKLRVVPPQVKRLADGDIGMGAMADLDEIVAAVRSLLPPPGGGNADGQKEAPQSVQAVRRDVQAPRGVQPPGRTRAPGR